MVERCRSRPPAPREFCRVAVMAGGPAPHGIPDQDHLSPIAGRGQEAAAAPRIVLRCPAFAGGPHRATRLSNRSADEQEAERECAAARERIAARYTAGD